MHCNRYLFTLQIMHPAAPAGARHLLAGAGAAEDLPELVLRRAPQASYIFRNTLIACHLNSAKNVSIIITIINISKV